MLRSKLKGRQQESDYMQLYNISINYEAICYLVQMYVYTHIYTSYLSSYIHTHTHYRPTTKSSQLSRVIEALSLHLRRRTCRSHLWRGDRGFVDASHHPQQVGPRDVAGELQKYHAQIDEIQDAEDAQDAQNGTFASLLFGHFRSGRLRNGCAGADGSGLRLL